MKASSQANENCFLAGWRIFLLASALLGLLAWSEAAVADELEDEIGGLVIDRTITRFGKDFYRDFSIQWQSVKGSSRYALAIIEQPLPQSGTLLTIDFRGQKVYQTFFGRRQGVISEQMVQQAVAVVVNHMATILEQSINPDMQGDGY